MNIAGCAVAPGVAVVIGIRMKDCGGIVLDYKMKLLGTVWDEPKRFHLIIMTCVNALCLRKLMCILIVLYTYYIIMAYGES